MTQEGAKKHKDVIKAFCEGKQIQYYSETNERWTDILAPEFVFRTEYRVKPEPKLVPFDYSDAEKLIGKSVRHKDGKFVAVIINVSEDSICVGTLNRSFETLLRFYTFLDGSLCGKVVE